MLKITFTVYFVAIKPCCLFQGVLGRGRGGVQIRETGDIVSASGFDPENQIREDTGRLGRLGRKKGREKKGREKKGGK